MKKTTILAVAASLAMTISGFSQGYITFQNNGTELLTIPGGASAPVTGTSGIDVELFYQKDTGQAAPAPITAASLGSWEGISTPLATIGPIAGRFSQSVITGNDIAGAGEVWLEAVAFNGSSTSLQNALLNPATTMIGYGNVFAQGTGDGGSVAAVSTALNGLTGFALAPVPEPSTIVLGGLGAAALLAFRRRK